MPSKLPHDRLTTGSYHLTYRLAGSLPQGFLAQLSDRRRRSLTQLEVQLLDLHPNHREELMKVGRRRIDEQYETAIDRALHRAQPSGPLYLQQEEVAACVLDSWQYFHQSGEVILWAVCVMGNHVHVVLSAGEGKTEVDLGAILENHKGFTGRMANRLLQRTGTPFWAPGYFDRRIRRGRFQQVVWYVLNNPVKANLVKDWTAWPSSWVHPEYRPMFTGCIPERL